MKSLILVIIIFLFSFSYGQNSDLIENINISQLLAHQMNNNKELAKVINFYDYYLANKGIDSLEKGTETTINFTKSILFPSWLPSYGYKLYILNAKSLPNNTYEVKLCLKISYTDEVEESKDQYLYIYNARIAKEDDVFYLDYNLRTEGLIKLQTKNISYLYNPISTTTIDTIGVFKYCYNIAGIFDQKFDYPLTYAVSDYYDAYEIFGFEHALEASGRNIPGGILVSVNNTFLDKHELCHAVLKDIEFPHFLSEGIATYFGGTNNYSTEDYFNKFREEVWTKHDNKTKQKYIKRYLDNDNSIVLDKDYMTFFYLASAKLVEKAVKEKGIENLAKYTMAVPKYTTPRKYIEEYLHLNLNEQYFMSIFN